jgi:RES domain-containing protein
MPQTLWRLAPASHADTAFTGQGAERFGGRWNEAGTAMVYLSETLSLAVLGIVVHLRVQDFRRDFVCFRVDVPDTSLPIPDPSWKPPEDWRAEPPVRATKELGTAWARAGASALLRVPSAVVPSEYNVLLNPRQADFPRLRIHPPERFHLDNRLLPPARDLSRGDG